MGMQPVTVAGEPDDQEAELVNAVPGVLDMRRDAGLDGLVGDLDAVIITTEQDRLLPAAAELLMYTGFACSGMVAGRFARTCTLSKEGSASVILQARTQGANPFLSFNTAPAAKPLRNTRLETFVFSTPDIAAYVAIQRSRGVPFLTKEPVALADGLFIQTAPSRFTGNSLGFMQWHDTERSYRPAGDLTELPAPPKPPREYLGYIGKLDHTATRVRAQERNAAILEFLALTNYHYDFAVYVKSLNSITSVARRAARRTLPWSLPPASRPIPAIVLRRAPPRRSSATTGRGCITSHFTPKRSNGRSPRWAATGSRTCSTLWVRRKRG